MDLIDAYLAAERIRQSAATVRARAQLAAELSQHITWRSLAGTAFRERAQVMCAELLGLGARLDALADTIQNRATVSALPR